MNSKKSSMQGRKPLWLEYLMIIVGTGLMSLAINSVFDASGMVTGGFSGIAIIIKAWTKGLVNGGIPLWVTNCVLNIPLFFIAWRVKGFSFIKKAILGEISLSVWLAIQPVFHLAGDDLLLAALYGGVIQGVGIGLVFLGGGTTSRNFFSIIPFLRSCRLLTGQWLLWVCMYSESIRPFMPL